MCTEIRKIVGTISNSECARKYGENVCTRTTGICARRHGKNVLSRSPICHTVFRLILPETRGLGFGGKINNKIEIRKGKRRSLAVAGERRFVGAIDEK